MLTVFGSLNVDICVRVDRMPRPGETLLGAQALVSPGGKGANQAHAAALFGASTRMHGAVGVDGFAETALSLLRAHGVDLSGVQPVQPESTGLAVITVDASGENAIVVASGANGRAAAAQVPDDVLARSRVLLVQLEVPWSESLAVARRAKQLGCTVILNASPMPLAWDVVADAIDILVVNKIEMEQLCSRLNISDSDPIDQATRAASALGLRILLTLGADGSLIANPDGSKTVTTATPLKQVVDTTGAGDTYVGVFAAALAMELSHTAAMEAASAAAGLTCQAVGAQVAQPSRASILAELARTRAHP